MNATMISEIANRFGRDSREAFCKKTGKTPTMENSTDWIEAEWPMAWEQLRKDGAIDSDQDTYFNEWTDGFFQGM
jgi:hypothetical protein